ncbi:MAG TPA: alpha/beta hydrolase [Candidatus Solibacter sp.]|nr:alpha/beta hydrolase [Candidatus Solibacter sp.]
MFKAFVTLKMICNNHSGNPSLSKGALLGVVVLAGLMQGCHSPLRCPVRTRLPEPCPPQVYLADVLFATDRSLTNKERAEFSGSRNLADGHMTYGSKCEDPAGSLAGCTSSKIFEKQDFFRQIHDRQKDVLLFVPGYKYSFDETLQLGLRIVERSEFDSTVVAYAWPSRNRLLAYGADYDTNEWSVEHLADFLVDIVNALPEGKVLHIAAHSIGNRMVLQALLRLRLSREKLGELIMIAPDVDAQTFVEQVPKCGAFRRKTVYISPRDQALKASDFWFHSNTPRAGEEYVVLNGLETIDASRLHTGITGHAYFENSQLMLDDLGAVLKGVPVEKRQLDKCSVKALESKSTPSAPSIVYCLPNDQTFSWQGLLRGHRQNRTKTRCEVR